MDDVFVHQLECEHTIYLTFKLRQQYASDYHYVLCPSCRESPKVEFGWKKVVKDNGVQSLYSVQKRPIRYVPADWVIRIQPSVPGNRAHPFPYKPRVSGVRFS